jgi:diguanylate cyclase (GGDEF)-like protein/PAS domain S-box-containing protein
VLDPDGRILRFNRACEVVTGYTFGEVQGIPFYDLLVPKDEIDAVKLALSEVRAGEPPAASENHWLTRDGELRLIRWLDTCFFDDAGALTHIVSTGLDITEERRAEEALHGIEAIGTLLATSGPTPETLAAVLETLSERMGYRYMALLLVEGTRLRLGAQLGYEPLPRTFEADAGIVGRVLQAGQATLVPDISSDPDYIEGHPDVVSEIAVPLSAEGRRLGVLSIGGTAQEPLTVVDLRLARAVGERLAMALVLGREQQLLAHRARLFGALNDFARTANSILDEESLVPALLDAIAEIVPVDGLGVTVMNRETGHYVLQATLGAGTTPQRPGAIVRPGIGLVGKAIASRSLVVDRQGASSSRRRRPTPDIGPMVRLAAPLIHDEIVLGALSVARAATDDPGFTELEREVLTLVGTQAALALANAHLLAEVRALAIRDSLTGLYNRRHFDAALQHILARWARDRDLSRPVAAILFDLDHFGQFNKDHGHQAGDAVLRAFGGILLTRFRSADLVARYGGEEFVAILDGATRAQAMAVAEEIRSELESSAITGSEGQRLWATVSAGCAALDAREPTREALLRTADTGLSMAKRSGRNRVVAA